MRDGVAACSPDCCRKVDLAQWNRLQKEPRKLFSQVMKSIVRIGIQLFSYNPCKITPLFPP